MIYFTLYCTSLLAILINAAPIDEDFVFAKKKHRSNVGELGNYFEGDMVLTPLQYVAIAEAERGRNGLRDVTKRWPDRIVVYHIVDDDFDEDQVEMIEDGLADIANNSCIKFRKQKGTEHAVIIQGSANGCFSGVGYNKPDDMVEVSQVLNLAKGCFKHGTIVHEMLHTLGFYHMQSTYDRDEYVEIVWENIKEGHEHNFAKYNKDTVTDFGVPYDYGSVMHYPELAFSKNGNKTIIALEEGVVIGQRKGELGNYFEGDMVLTPLQYVAIAEAERGRNGLRDVTKRWPDRIVVYHIVDDDFDEDQVEMIEDGLADIANNSCIKFRKQKGTEHAVIIQGSANGCFSGVGYNKPDDMVEVSQVLNLAKGCFKHGTIVHEMLHTLGFYHMQSTYDRDEYVEIVWENIKEGHEHNFAKYNKDTVTDFGVPYDYGSVMHYPELAFSKNGNKTIIALEEGVVIGQRKGLSESDIVKLNKMYCE